MSKGFRLCEYPYNGSVLLTLFITMNAKIIDGKALAQSVRAGLKEKVEQFKLSSRAPGLTVILVGDNPASQVYVRNKIKACTDVGLSLIHI